MENAMVVNQARIQEELGLDFEKLWKTITEEFHLFFKNKPYSAESLELLSTYFFEVGDYKKMDHSADAKLILQKAIDLLNLADETENSLSMERIGRKRRIEKMIREIKVME